FRGLKKAASPVPVTKAASISRPGSRSPDRRAAPWLAFTWRFAAGAFSPPQWSAGSYDRTAFRPAPAQNHRQRDPDPGFDSGNLAVVAAQRDHECVPRRRRFRFDSGGAGQRGLFAAERGPAPLRLQAGNLT